jgi:tRNA(Leu) C34 or U34 (ribose-2'-O)-methylase TrmL
MARLEYTDLIIDFTLTDAPNASFPSIIQAGNLINDLYRQAAELYDVTYTATVPDDATLYAVIKTKLSNWIMTMKRKRTYSQNFSQELPILLFTEEEKAILQKSDYAQVSNVIQIPMVKSRYSVTN